MLIDVNSVMLPAQGQMHLPLILKGQSIKRYMYLHACYTRKTHMPLYLCYWYCMRWVLWEIFDVKFFFASLWSELPGDQASIFFFKVDNIKIKRKVSLFSSTPFLFLLLSLFLFFCIAWSDFKTFRSREVQVHIPLGGMFWHSLQNFSHTYWIRIRSAVNENKSSGIIMFNSVSMLWGSGDKRNVPAICTNLVAD